MPNAPPLLLEGSPRMLPRGPRSPAQLCAAQQTTSDPTNNPSSPAKTKTSVTQATDEMAYYSTPSRYAGVLHALEVLSVDLDTAPLPGLLALVRSIDPDLATQAMTKAWDHHTARRMRNQRRRSVADTESDARNDGNIRR